MKSISLALLFTAILIFSGCGSNKVANTTIINTDKTYTSPQNSKKPNKRLTQLDTSITQKQKKEFLTRINDARSQRRSCGKYGSMGPAEPLAWSDKLYKAASLHSYDMAKSRHFSHDGSGSINDRIAADMGLGRGSNLRDRMSYTDYRWRTVGENIASGQQSTQAVIEAWLRSDEHCKNLMNKQFREVGMAYYQLNGQFQQPYWSQNFGRSL